MKYLEAFEIYRHFVFGWSFMIYGQDFCSKIEPSFVRLNGRYLDINSFVKIGS